MVVLYFVLVIFVVCILVLILLFCVEKIWRRKIVVFESDGIDRNECWSGVRVVSFCRILDYVLEYVINFILV